MKAIDYRGDLESFLIKYNYQPELTFKLDNLNNTSFSQEIVNEIVLWKVNRYVSFSAEIMKEIEKLKNLTNGQHRKAQAILEALLRIHGVDLPMASTFLRFRNPRVFQIIDQHAYRAIFGQKYPLNTASPFEKKISTYFEYIDKLIELCTVKNLDFQTIDRLLYIFDKKITGKLKEN